MTYQEIKKALIPYKINGLTSIKINSKKAVLEAELTRLQNLAKSLNYSEVRAKLTEYKKQGLTQVALNASRAALDAELNRIFATIQDKDMYTYRRHYA